MDLKMVPSLGSSGIGWVFREAQFVRSAVVETLQSLKRFMASGSAGVVASMSSRKRGISG